jgi:hypothetical protein
VSLSVESAVGYYHDQATEALANIISFIHSGEVKKVAVLTIESRVTSAINLAHASRADLRDDCVVCESSVGGN